MIQVTEKTLYEKDFALWLQKTIARLQVGDLHDLDTEHLIEELEGLSGRDRQELESRLEVLLAHILKRVYVYSAYDNHGCKNTIEHTIIEQRRRLSRKLQQSPSLRHYFVDVFDDCFSYALAQVCRDYPQVQFPDRWPFSLDIDEILSEQLW
jgi:Domain of unknown function DUF29